MKKIIALFILTLLSADIAVGQIVSTDAAPEPVNVKKQKRIADNSKRFPNEKEWQNSFFFCNGKVGQYDLSSSGSGFLSSGSYAWDLGYIGGGLFRKSLFVGLGTGVSGYYNKLIHKQDVTVPFFVHLKWYALGNSIVSPYIATSQGLDLYFCQDYAKSNLILGLHSRFDAGVHIRPNKNSKFGITAAFEFGLAPYNISKSEKYEYNYIYRYGNGWNYDHTIYKQRIIRQRYNTVSYFGTYLAITF